MPGIKTVVSYIPEQSVSNYDRKEKFGIDDNFIENKIGIRKISKKESNEKASDLCVRVFEKLIDKISLDKETIDCVVVVTQNPDYKMPCTAAIVHGKLNLPENCACFDVALGCSGYVYGLSVITAFMKSNDLKNGLLFTSDPFSDIVDTEDKTTALLFGDASTVSVISENADWFPKNFLFGTRGSGYREIICEDKFFMNGRSVFEFAATTVPKHISELLKNHDLEDKDIDKYILHQGSKYIVDTITKRLNIEPEKVPFDIHEYGNTISSSIPIILEKEFKRQENKRMLLSGFGVGLSWGSVVIEKMTN